MIVPLFTPPWRIDASNVGEFAATVDEFVTRYRAMVLDCSDVEWITVSGVRVLDTASRAAPITLVNPSPALHLMAATFAHDVLCRFEQQSSRSIKRTA